LKTTTTTTATATATGVNDDERLTKNERIIII